MFKINWSGEVLQLLCLSRSKRTHSKTNSGVSTNRYVWHDCANNISTHDPPKDRPCRVCYRSTPGKVQSHSANNVYGISNGGTLEQNKC